MWYAFFPYRTTQCGPGTRRQSVARSSCGCSRGQHSSAQYMGGARLIITKPDWSVSLKAETVLVILAFSLLYSREENC